MLFFGFSVLLLVISYGFKYSFWCSGFMPGAPLPSCPEAPSSPSHLPESVHVRSYRHESITWLPNEKGCPSIERFHSHGQHLCKFIGTKESVCIRKEFNSHGTGLGHQHDRRFIVLGHQYGRRDVMWKHYYCFLVKLVNPTTNRPRLRRACDFVYDSDFWFSQGHKRYYDFEFYSVASENQP